MLVVGPGPLPVVGVRPGIHRRTRMQRLLFRTRQIQRRIRRWRRWRRWRCAAGTTPATLLRSGRRNRRGSGPARHHLIGDRAARAVHHRIDRRRMLRLCLARRRIVREHGRLARRRAAWSCRRAARRRRRVGWWLVVGEHGRLTGWRNVGAYGRFAWRRIVRRRAVREHRRLGCRPWLGLLGRGRWVRHPRRRFGRRVRLRLRHRGNLLSRRYEVSTVDPAPAGATGPG
jgi:hypothetical protein